MSIGIDNENNYYNVNSTDMITNMIANLETIIQDSGWEIKLTPVYCPVHLSCC